MTPAAAVVGLCGVPMPAVGQASADFVLARPVDQQPTGSPTATTNCEAGRGAKRTPSNKQIANSKYNYNQNFRTTRI